MRPMTAGRLDLWCFRVNHFIVIINFHLSEIGVGASVSDSVRI